MNTVNISISQQLSEYIVETNFIDINVKTIRKTKDCIIDWAASTYGGSNSESTTIICKVLNEKGSDNTATCIPSKSKIPASSAAYINASSCHVLQMDDYHKMSLVHGAAPIISCAMAVAEKEDVSGQDLITAIVLGYEIALRTGECLNPSHSIYWNSTSTCGAIGAAVAAGKILKLSKQKMANAIGLAGSMTGGVWEGLADGDLSSRLHPGNAARNGLITAYLAAHGFPGPVKIFEGGKGICKAMSTDYNLNKLFWGLGNNKFKIDENSLKYYSSCGYTHSAVDAIIQALGERVLTNTVIEKIEVEIFERAIYFLGSIKETTPYFAKYNIKYVVSTAVLDKQVDLLSFTEKAVQDPEKFKLMEKIEIKPSGQLTSLFPEKWATRIVIHLIDGEILEGYCEYPKGDINNPLSDDELKNKFFKLTSLHESPIEPFKLFEKLNALEGINNISSLFQQYL